MKFEYEATFRIDVGKAIPAVDELMNSVNDHLSTMGYSERVNCQADIGTMVLSVDRELTKEEENKVKTLLQAEMIESSLGRYDVRLVGFRRKPGNVESSAV